MVPVESDLFSHFGQQVETGAVVFREGVEGDQMFIIQDGRVKVSRAIGGKEQLLAVLGKGDFFGEMALVTRERRTATVTTLEPVRLLAFNREGFLNMINKNPKIALNIIDKLCRRLAYAHQHLRHLARKDARALIAMDLRLGFQAAAGGATLDLERTVEEFARNLELDSAQVRGVLEDFLRIGIVRLAAGGLQLADEPGLNGIAEPLGV
jgi:CRP/FNR family cyclic AMP-dependent transcriptional regulator